MDPDFIQLTSKGLNRDDKRRVYKMLATIGLSSYASKYDSYLVDMNSLQDEYEIRAHHLLDMKNKNTKNKNLNTYYDTSKSLSAHRHHRTNSLENFPFADKTASVGEILNGGQLGHDEYKNTLRILDRKRFIARFFAILKRGRPGIYFSELKGALRMMNIFPTDKQLESIFKQFPANYLRNNKEASTTEKENYDIFITEMQFATIVEKFINNNDNNLDRNNHVEFKQPNLSTLFSNPLDNFNSYQFSKNQPGVPSQDKIYDNHPHDDDFSIVSGGSGIIPMSARDAANYFHRHRHLSHQNSHKEGRYGVLEGVNQYAYQQEQGNSPYYDRYIDNSTSPLSSSPVSEPELGVETEVRQSIEIPATDMREVTSNRRPLHSDSMTGKARITTNSKNSQNKQQQQQQQHTQLKSSRVSVTQPFHTPDIHPSRSKPKHHTDPIRGSSSRGRSGDPRRHSTSDSPFSTGKLRRSRSGVSKRFSPRDTTASVLRRRSGEQRAHSKPTYPSEYQYLNSYRNINNHSGGGDFWNKSGRHSYRRPSSGEDYKMTQGRYLGSGPYYDGVDMGELVDVEAVVETLLSGYGVRVRGPINKPSAVTGRDEGIQGEGKEVGAGRGTVPETVRTLNSRGFSKTSGRHDNEDNMDDNDWLLGDSSSRNSQTTGYNNNPLLGPETYDRDFHSHGLRESLSAGIHRSIAEDHYRRSAERMTRQRFSSISPQHTPPPHSASTGPVGLYARKAVLVTGGWEGRGSGGGLVASFLPYDRFLATLPPPPPPQPEPELARQSSSSTPVSPSLEKPSVPKEKPSVGDGVSMTMETRQVTAGTTAIATEGPTSSVEASGLEEVKSYNDELLQQGVEEHHKRKQEQEQPQKQASELEEPKQTPLQFLEPVSSPGSRPDSRTSNILQIFWDSGEGYFKPATSYGYGMQPSSDLEREQSVTARETPIHDTDSSLQVRISSAQRSSSLDYNPQLPQQLSGQLQSQQQHHHEFIQNLTESRSSDGSATPRPVPLPTAILDNSNQFVDSPLGSVTRRDMTGAGGDVADSHELSGTDQDLSSSSLIIDSQLVFPPSIFSPSSPPLSPSRDEDDDDDVSQVVGGGAGVRVGYDVRNPDPIREVSRESSSRSVASTWDATSTPSHRRMIHHSETSAFTFVTTNIGSGSAATYGLMTNPPIPPPTPPVPPSYPPRAVPGIPASPSSMTIPYQLAERYPIFPGGIPPYHSTTL